MRWKQRDRIEARDRTGKVVSFPTHPRRKRRWPRWPQWPRWRGGRRRYGPWRKVRILGLIALLIIGAPEVLGYLGVQIRGGTGCSVVRVIDGDTVRAYCPGRGLLSARLRGFDTPEVYSPQCVSEWWAGTKATWALRRRLWTAGEVKLILSGTDRYDRSLATLLVDGRNIAGVMIEAGHARAYSGGQRTGWCW